LGRSKPKHQRRRSVTTLAQRGRTWRPFDDANPDGRCKFDAKAISYREPSA